MFLIRNDVSEKSLERMASQVSCHSWSSYSTTSSSGVGGGGNPANAGNNSVPPSNAVITALIRDLSFWDAIPPASSEDDRCDFPSPLPQRPKNRQQQQQRRRSSSSSINSSSRQQLKSQPSFGKHEQQQQRQQQPQFLLKRGKNVSSSSSSLREHSGHQHHQNHHGYTRQRSSEMLQRGSSKSTIDDNSAWRPQPVWKAAVDPMTGRTYYYDAVTRRTQWEKPAEVRQMEKQKKSQRRKRDKLFFQEMEKNIMKSLSRGEVIPGIPRAKLEPTGPPLEPRNAMINPLGGSSVARNFRTLSRMDDTILAELRDDLISPEEFDRALQAQQQHSKRTKPRSTSRGRPPLPSRSNSGSNGRSSNNNDRSRSRSRSQRRSQQQPQQQQHVDRQPLDRGEGNEQQSGSTGVTRVNTGSAAPPLPRSTSPRNGTNGGTNTSTLRTKPPQQPMASSSSGNNNNNNNGDNDNSQACPPAEGLAGEGLLVDGPIQAEIQALAEKSVRAMKKSQHVRRNTGGTIYVNGTMSNPDVEATIKCICGVYRAHLVQASEEERNKHSPVSVISKQPMDLQLEVFNDRFHLPTSWKQNMQQDSLPSLADIVEFYQEFYRRSQMEFDTIIMSLIYVERLIKTTNLTPGPENWRSVLFSCMVLASKVWDDLSMWNVDFSNVASAQSSNQSQGLSLFTLQRVNQLELILLKSLNFNVRVPASEYAKYYFLIRTMLMRSGLMEGAAKPLGKEEAKKLENRTSQYQDSKLNNNQQQQRDRRWKSMYDYSWLDKSSEEEKGELNKKACLEQIVNMSEHT